MKTKEEHISFWMEQSEDDWKAVFSLLIGKNYLQALFFTHLVIEKLCKALWIKYNTENVPPRSHNLVYLLAATPIILADEQNEFLLKLNRFQLEGRYPEYISSMHRICNEQFAKLTVETSNELRLWLLRKLQ